MTLQATRWACGVYSLFINSEFVSQIKNMVTVYKNYRRHSFWSQRVRVRFYAMPNVRGSHARFFSCDTAFGPLNLMSKLRLTSAHVARASGRRQRQCVSIFPVDSVSQSYAVVHCFAAREHASSRGVQAAPIKYGHA